MATVKDRFPIFCDKVLKLLHGGERHTQDLADALRRERAAPPHSPRVVATIAHRLRLMARAGLIRCAGVRVAPVNRFSNLAGCYRPHPARVTFWSLPAATGPVDPAGGST
jgi:hypothetical protein